MIVVNDGRAKKRQIEFIAVLLLIAISTVGLAGCAGLVSGTSKTSSDGTPVAPAISTQPVSQTVTAGQTATFSVLVTGTAPMSYKWLKNNAAIAGATAASYTTPATTSADNGSQFVVVVTNAAGSMTSSTATLTVTAAVVVPSITAQPLGETVTTGQTATFSVVATGTAPLSYQWKKNNTAIAGATAASYTTPATTSADNGSQFVVVVSDSAGNTTSNTATLTVTAAAVAPSITTQPASQTVTAGQTATFSVVATGTAPLSYQWKKNNTAIAGATVASYTTPATTSADNGSQFVVVVSNTAGNMTSGTATLTVNAATVAPSITTQPASQSVTTGQTATFSVVAAGTAPLSYQWKKNSAAIAGATAANYTTPATTSADNGSQFVVVVSNTAGNMTSSTATLTVTATAVAPSITTQPASQTVTAGQTATFRVVATGTAPLSYQWKKNNTAIAGATAANYTTPATTSADNGSQFVVVVSNTAGNMTSGTATLTVNAAAVAPSITTQPASETVTAGQTATFSVVATGTAPLNYQWEKNSAAIAGATAASYTTPATTSADNGSQFVVVVSNTAGNMTSSTATLTVNSSGTLPGVPTGLTATAISSSQINLIWTASTGSVTGYKIYRGGTQVGTSASTNYSDTSLTASTSYSYTVSAYDAAGDNSAQSAGASATTLASSSGGGLPSSLGWYQIPNTMMQNVCPTGYNCENVIVPWSGGVADTSRNRLIVWGGGHSDYSGNEVYALDLNSLTMLRLNNPSPAVSGCTEVSSDGTPPSRHTYDGLAYIASADRMLSVDGSMAPTGCASVDTWTLAFSNLTWQNMNPTGTAPLPNGGVAASDYDPNTQNVFIHTTSYGQFATYNFATNSYHLLATFEDINYYVTAVIDPTRKLFLMFGAGGAYKIDISGNDPTYALTTLTASGCSGFISAQAPGAAYDTVQNLVVGWSGGNTAYLYNPSTDSCTSVTYPNGPAAQQSLGTYGRFRYFPALGVFALVNDAAQNAWALRLTPATGGTGGSGPAISAVAVNSITTNSATVTWTTDVASTSQVEYGTTTAYGTLTTLNTSLVTSHVVAVAGLSTNTLYHYRVHSKNSAGVESISGDFSFQTNNTTDTTPPTVSITSPSSGATVSGTTSIAATATDNVGVASVQFLLDSVNLGAPITTAPYTMSWDTTTATNAAHTLGAQATDTSGNVGTAIPVSLTVANTGTDPALADFQARCAAPGVLRCEGWDDPADFVPATGDGGYASGLYPAEDGTFQGVQDTSIKLSGAGSLKFIIRAGSVSPLGSNPSGYWKANFGPDTSITQFGPGTTLYMQFRLRLDPELINFDWTTVSGQGWKVFIAFGPVPGPSCTGAQFVQENTNQTNVATGYTSCGTPALDTNNGVPPMSIEQGDYNCPYTDGGAYASNPNCFAYPVNTWMTEYWVVSIGQFGQPNTSFTAYIAADGQPLKKFIDLPNFTFDQGADPGDALMELLLQPYFSGATNATTSPASAMWFDELVISTQPIAAPLY